MSEAMQQEQRFAATDEQFLDSCKGMPEVFEDRIGQISAIADMLEAHVGDVQEGHAYSVGLLLDDIAEDLRQNLLADLTYAIHRLEARVHPPAPAPTQEPGVIAFPGGKT